MGATAAYLLDPVNGRRRRADLIAQARSQVTDAVSTVDTKTRYQSGRAKGWLHETFVSQDAPEDDQTLLQKVRSEAVGPTRGDLGHIEIRVENGVVRLLGVSADPLVEQELAKRIAHVTGVTEVSNELAPHS
jgi:osmotically-inducible protein OsmY